MIQDTTCVIAHFGRVAMTHDAVRAVHTELAAENVIVIDNGRDYTEILGETVVRPLANIGWLRACNLGLAQSFAGTANFALLLNNDVTLSPSFVGGLIAAANEDPRIGIVAPCYDGPFRSQQTTWTGDVSAYASADPARAVRLVDGTAVLIARRCYTSVGEFDAELFGNHGWGAITDYCKRATTANFEIAVTPRSYLHHFMGASATEASSTYMADASAEMERGLRKLYGPEWRRQLGYYSDGGGTPPALRQRIRSRLTSVLLPPGNRFPPRP